MITSFTKRKKARILTKRAMISILMFFSMVVCLFPQPARAQMWGTSDIFGDFILNMLTNIQRQIEGALIGTLKMAAVQMLNQQIGQLIGGGAGGQARFITNFNDFLYQGPAQRTELYMNDFFTMTTRGKGSSANYMGIGDTGGIGGNYTSYLVSVQKQASVGNEGISVYNLDEYGGPEAMAKGNPLAFYAFFSNLCNNPFGCAMQAQEVSQNKLAMEQQAAAIEAQSTGVLGAKEGDNVIAPAASIEAMMVKIQNLPADIIANATNPAELMGGVVSAMANKVVTNLVQNGIGQVQANIQREIGGVNSQVNAALKQATGSLGPAAPFTQSIIQRSIRINPSTPAIPNNGTGGP